MKQAQINMMRNYSGALSSWVPYPDIMVGEPGRISKKVLKGVLSIEWKKKEEQKRLVDQFRTSYLLVTQYICSLC